MPMASVASPMAMTKSSENSCPFLMLFAISSRPYCKFLPAPEVRRVSRVIGEPRAVEPHREVYVREPFLLPAGNHVQVAYLPALVPEPYHASGISSFELRGRVRYVQIICLCGAGGGVNVEEYGAQAIHERYFAGFPGEVVIV